MPKKTTSIPVNSMTEEFGGGMAIEKIVLPDLKPDSATTSTRFEEEARQSHRHDGHSFFLLETGIITIEIDFQTYQIESPVVMYVHPDQVHRTLACENVTVSSLTIRNENLNPDYLKLLEEIRPAKPLALEREIFTTISEAVSLCIKFSERKKEKLYHSMLKDSCNALTALIVSQYLEQSASTHKLSRFEIVSNAFKAMLEREYASTKSPAAYARELNISTPYLNECVKKTTGVSVSNHIQERVILEAKRLLYYSNKSVKEIAFGLGFDDYPYFSRLFTKVAGMSAQAFRQKNSVWL
jgi:AraC family transcriptional regulator, transcriptional activator of pobA